MQRLLRLAVSHGFDNANIWEWLLLCESFQLFEEAFLDLPQHFNVALTVLRTLADS